MSRFLALALFLALPLPAFAQQADAGTSAQKPSADPLQALPAAEPISFKAAVEKAEVTLGDTFGLTIEVRHSPEETYQLPSSLDLKAFSVRDRKVEVRGEETKTTVFRLTLQAFDLGDQEIPAIRLIATTAEGARQLEIPPQKVKVAGVIDLTQGQPQMKEDTRPLPTRKRPVWWPFALVGAVALAALCVWLWQKRKARPVVAAPPKPRLPPFEEALERLTGLEREALVAQGRKQEYFFRLSEILRDYVGRRFGFEALELTTDELLADLRARPTPGLDFDALAGFLREADLVKFARSEPSDGECKSALDNARYLVERTQPLPETLVDGRAAS